METLALILIALTQIWYLLIGIGSVYALFIIPHSLRRIAKAKAKQAEALDDIAESIDLVVFGTVGDEEPSYLTRLVVAVEKVAGISPPPDPKAGDGAME